MKILFMLMLLALSGCGTLLDVACMMSEVQKAGDQIKSKEP